MSLITASKTEKVLSEDGKAYWIRSGALTLLEKVSSLIFSLGTSMILWRMLSTGAYNGWGIFLIIAAFVEMGRSGLLQNSLVSFLTINRQHPEEYKKITTVLSRDKLCFYAFDQPCASLCYALTRRKV